MRLALICTGGTIGSKAEEDGIDVISPEEKIVEQLLSIRPSNYPSFVPDIFHPFTVLSENMTPRHWVKLTECIAQRIQDGYDGIVVTHGTDSMAYSLAAVSFMLGSIKVPIVFTGALVPYGQKESDAHQNLWDALLFAANHDYAGVYLVFQPDERGRFRDSRSVLWGPRVQSIRARGLGFESVDNRFIARIEQGKIRDSKDPFKRQKKKEGERMDPRIDVRFNRRVDVIKIYPGFLPERIEHVGNSGIRAVIIDLYHSGTACARNFENEQYSIVPAIEQLVRKDIAVLGAGAPFRANEQYNSTSALIQAGLHPLGRMTLEATVVKAMCLIGRGVKSTELGKQMDASLLNEVYHGTA